LAAIAVLVVPIIVFMLTALGVFLLVFLVLSLVSRIGRFFGGMMGTGGGRRNVRVVRVDR
jgi:hypothetical protein